MQPVAYREKGIESRKMRRLRLGWARRDGKIQKDREDVSGTQWQVCEEGMQMGGRWEETYTSPKTIRQMKKDKTVHNLYHKGSLWQYPIAPICSFNKDDLCKPQYPIHERASII
jgi:hypothetical protein